MSAKKTATKTAESGKVVIPSDRPDSVALNGLKLPRGSGYRYCNTLTCDTAVNGKLDTCPVCKLKLPESGTVKATASGRTRTRKAAAARTPAPPKETPTFSLLKVIKGRGWNVKGTRDIFDPNGEIEYSAEEKIQPLLKFADQFTKEGKFLLTYDELCGLLKLPLNK